MITEIKNYKNKNKKIYNLHVKIIKITIKISKKLKIMLIKQMDLCKSIYGNMLIKLMENYKLSHKKLWKILINMFQGNFHKIFNLKIQMINKNHKITAIKK